MNKAISILIILSIGVGILWVGTDGLKVLTTEGERRKLVEEQPRPLPPVTLRDQRGELFNFQDFQGSNVLVEFIYTRCSTLCHELGQTFEYVAEKIPPYLQGRHVYLISISFDPRDTVEDLRSYGDRYGTIPDFWKIARVENKKELKLLLETFGITVIPNQRGDFEHNAGVHFVNKSVKLDKIVSLEPHSEVIKELVLRL